MPILTVPGITNSGPDHWQTLWEQVPERSCTRFRPSSWDEPSAFDWVSAVHRGVRELGEDTVVVAHSLGCLAAATAATEAIRFRAAILVAPPDVAGAQFPKDAQGFDRLTLAPLTVPALVISSSDDPYSSVSATAKLVAQIGADHVDVGRHGHLNSASGLGAWLLGWLLVQGFAATAPIPG